MGLEAISNKVNNDNNIGSMQGTVTPKVNEVKTQPTASNVVKKEEPRKIGRAHV